MMLTDRQRMQIRRSIGYNHGFLPETVSLESIKIVPKSIVIEGGKIEIEVDFSHTSGYWGSDVFLFDPTDLRKIPLWVRRV
jgi:hypothetical protein